MLTDWPLCRVFLKNNAAYPWFLLVPRIENIQEIYQLPKASQHQLIDEISQLSTIVNTQFNPDKLNVGTLGNMVSQLHIHVVARFKHDSLWPHGIWQAAQTDILYHEETVNALLKTLKLNYF